MAFSYLWAQIKLILHRRKNLLVIGLALVGMFAYVIDFEGRTLPPEGIDLAAAKQEHQNIADYLRVSGGSLNNPGIANTGDAERLLLKGVKQHRRADLLKGLRLQLIRQDGYWLNQEDVSYPVVYYQDRSKTAQPREDGHFNNVRMKTRIKYYQAHPALPVTLARVNERTFLQTLARVSRQYLPIAVILVTLWLANNVICDDWRHPSVTWGLPLGQTKRYWLKAAAVLLVVFALVALFVLVVAVATIPRFGVGTGARIAQHYGVHYAFRTISLAEYLGWTASLLVGLTLVWTRLSEFLQLVTRNEYLTLIGGYLLLLAPVVYFDRGIGLWQPWTTRMLTTVTEAGQVVDGTQNFLYGVAQLTPQWALFVLIGWWVVIEGLLQIAGAVYRKRGWAA